MTERATSSIGSILRDGRLQRGLTEEELGARVGQTAETISRYESGRSVPDSETMAALNAELKLSSAVTDVNYVPKHSADPAPVTPATLDAEPAWETLTVDGAVPALPPVVAPPDEPEEQETVAPCCTRSGDTRRVPSVVERRPAMGRPDQGGGGGPPRGVDPPAR